MRRIRCLFCGVASGAPLEESSGVLVSYPRRAVHGGSVRRRAALCCGQSEIQIHPPFAQRVDWVSVAPRPPACHDDRRGVGAFDMRLDSDTDTVVCGVWRDDTTHHRDVEHVRLVAVRGGVLPGMGTRVRARTVVLTPVVRARVATLPPAAASAHAPSASQVPVRGPVCDPKRTQQLRTRPMAGTTAILRRFGAVRGIDAVPHAGVVLRVSLAPNGWSGPTIPVLVGPGMFKRGPGIPYKPNPNTASLRVGLNSPGPFVSGQ